ncbi:MAG: FHA domain-containing protein [Planctomycetia bacterium]|nr:FHA domain-containing protein [Planctomycetia bacterium]
MTLSKSGGRGWGLEVVRGREVGRVFPIGPGPSVLGNALEGEAGIDLGAQETASPRRMAARQARVECSADGFSLLDLDSPGGTFVNRQRVLPGQARGLQPGDVIQLGAVQLRVVAGESPAKATAAPPAQPAPAKATRPGSLATPFAIAGGAACRTWDDFLTVSAQSWSALRDELTSGRLGTFLRAAGRDDLVPPPAPAKSADERLDEWLGRLPTTRPAHPDLDVHPTVVRVRAPAGGGTTRSKVVVTNTGYRLLRSNVRVEPPETGWVRVDPRLARGAFTTAESTEITLEVEIPEALTSSLSAFVVVESNGGNRRGRRWRGVH